MEKDDTKKFKQLITNKNLIITIVIAIAIFALLSIVPLLGYDDFILNYLSKNHTTSIFHEIFDSITYWSGRSTQLIGYLVGYCPRVVFFILNTIMIMLFLYFVYYFSYYHSKTDYSKTKMIPSFLFTLFYIFYIFQATFDDFFWMAGACNHLWSTVFNLAVLVPYYNMFFGKDILSNKKKIVIILFIILSLISGSSIEHLGVFMLPVMLTAIIYGIKKYKLKNKWSILSFISYLIGYLYIILLPSTTSRGIAQAKMIDSVSFSGFGKIKYLLYAFYQGNSIFIFIMLFVFLIYFLYKKIKKEDLKKSFKINLLLLLFSFSTLLIFYFVPYYSSRAIIFICFFMFININYIVINFFYSHKVLKIIFLLFLTISNIYAYSYFYRVYKSSNEAMKFRNGILVEQYNNGKKDIDFYYLPCKYGNRVIEYKETLYNPDALKKYYKIDESVQFIYRYPSVGDGYNKMCIKYNKVFNIIDDKILQKRGLYIDNREED